MEVTLQTLVLCWVLRTLGGLCWPRGCSKAGNWVLGSGGCVSISLLPSHGHCSPKVYKLLYASRLADHGLPAQALLYCEQIATVLLQQDPTSHPVLAQQLTKVSFVPLSCGSCMGMLLGAC